MFKQLLHYSLSKKSSFYSSVRVMVFNATFNYLCNQCLSPPKLWIRISFMAARCTRYNIMW